MKNLKEQLSHIGHSRKLAIKEKDLMRIRISEYQKMQPLSTNQPKPIRQTFSFMYFMQYRAMPVLIITLLVISSGAGAVYASNDALPGDKLYPVKEILEEIHAKVLLTDTARTKWAVRRAVRREEELTLLKKRGLLDKKRAEIITKKREQFRTRAEKAIKRIEQDNPEHAEKLRAFIERREDHDVETHHLRDEDKDLEKIKMPKHKLRDVLPIKKINIDSTKYTEKKHEQDTSPKEHVYELKKQPIHREQIKILRTGNKKIPILRESHKIKEEEDPRKKLDSKRQMHRTKKDKYKKEIEQRDK